MAEPILSIAVFEPFRGREDDCLAAFRELQALMAAKNYGRDLLYRDNRNPQRYFLLRYWASDEMRSEAQHDPAVHRLWIQLPELCSIREVYEQLDPI
jgi:hypothetical protein